MNFSPFQAKIKDFRAFEVIFVTSLSLVDILFVFIAEMKGHIFCLKYQFTGLQTLRYGHYAKRYAKKDIFFLQVTHKRNVLHGFLPMVRKLGCLIARGNQFLVRATMIYRRVA